MEMRICTCLYKMDRKGRINLADLNWGFWFILSPKSPINLELMGNDLKACDQSMGIRMISNILYEGMHYQDKPLQSVLERFEYRSKESQDVLQL